MSHVHEIIVLDDDEDEEKAPCPTKAKASPCHSSKQTNGREEESSSSHQSKAETISAENQTLFNEFIEYCSKLTLEHPEVISFLQGKYAKANPSYLSSVEFRNTLGRCLTRAQTKRSKVFVYINELCTALKANTQKRKVNLQAQPAPQPAAEKTVTLTENDGEAENVAAKKPGSKRQIRYLENLLRIYSQEIKKLQERELSLDELDDEDSSYIQESRLKRKLLRIFEKLCEIKDCSSLTGRVIEQRILYRGTRYPEINRRLEKFINSTRDLFPDYGDVLRVVERANEKHSLALTRKQMQSMAQDAFRELGNKLQDRRHLDMIYNFGCHLTDEYKSVNDPAQQDSSLARRLRENRETAMSHLDNIIKKYAELQDDGEEDFRMKTRRGTERNRRSSSEASEEEEEEEEEESEDSETDIEKELEQSEKMPDSEEGENEEEEIPADQENEADQKMEMASGGEDDGEKEKEDGDDENDQVREEATEQESSPTSTSLSHDKDSSNTTLESEAEAQLSASPDLPTLRSDSPTKAKSDDEHSEDTGDQMEEDQEHSDEGLKESEGNLLLTCESDIEDNVGKHKSLQKYLLPDMTVSLVGKDKDNSEQEAEEVTKPRDDPSREGSDAESASEPARSPAVQEESCTDVNPEEACVRRSSIDSEPASMEEEPVCADTPVNQDHVEDTAASGDERTAESPAMEREVTATSVQTETSDLDTCEKQKDCDLSPLRSSNGVHMFTPARGTSLNRLKLNKATHRDSPNPVTTERDSPLSNRKRKAVSSDTWTKNNGLTRYNGKEHTEEHTEKKCKKAKVDCSYTSLSSSSGSDSDEDSKTPGLMMTCSPRETPKKSTRKSHVSTQCDPDEVIVLSD